ncbi:hypothetical protein ACQYRI_18430 [Salmonella enterica]
MSILILAIISTTQEHK